MLDTRVVNGGVWGEPRLHELKHTGNEQSWFSRQQTAEKKIAVSSFQVPVFGFWSDGWRTQHDNTGWYPKMKTYCTHKMTCFKRLY